MEFSSHLNHLHFLQTPSFSFFREYPSLAGNDFRAVKSLHYPNNMSIKGGILYRLQRFVGGGHSFVKAVLWTSS